VEGRGGVRRRRLRSPSSREGWDEGGLSSFDLIRVHGGISAKHSHIDPWTPAHRFARLREPFLPLLAKTRMGPGGGDRSRRLRKEKVNTYMTVSLPCRLKWVNVKWSRSDSGYKPATKWLVVRPNKFVRPGGTPDLRRPVRMDSVVKPTPGAS
jgi:hypothetical protein